jgi:hypothetical protein
MTTLNHSHSTDILCRTVALLDQFPADIDPDFDDGMDELERQFAELRMTFAHN